MRLAVLLTSRGGQGGELPQLGADLPQLTVNQCGQAGELREQKKYAKCWLNSGQQLDHKFPRRATLKRGKIGGGAWQGSKLKLKDIRIYHLYGLTAKVL